MAGRHRHKVNLHPCLSRSLYPAFHLFRLQYSGFHSNSASQAFLNLHRPSLPNCSEGATTPQLLGKEVCRTWPWACSLQQCQGTSYCWLLSASHLCSRLSPMCIDWFHPTHPVYLAGRFGVPPKPDHAQLGRNCACWLFGAPRPSTALSGSSPFRWPTYDLSPLLTHEPHRGNTVTKRGPQTRSTSHLFPCTP